MADAAAVVFAMELLHQWLNLLRDADQELRFLLFFGERHPDHPLRRLQKGLHDAAVARPLKFHL